MKHLTIKKRLTVGVTLVSVAMTAVAVIAILISAHSLLYRELWAAIEDHARDASDEVEIEHGQLEIDDNIVFYSDGISILIHWPDGRLAAGNRPIGFPPDTAIVLGAGRTIGSAGGQWAVQDMLAEDGLVVRAIMSLNEVNGTLRSLTITAIIAWALYACAMWLGSYRIAFVALRPVDDIIKMAEEIRTGNDLSRRLQVSSVDDEISGLSRNFNAMFERLEASFEKERQFASDASHELRTPVATILAQCEYALAQPNLAEKDEALSSIQRNAERVSHLTSHLLALSRVSREDIDGACECVDLGELAMIVADEMRDAASLAGVTIDAKIACDALVIGDQTMLFQAVSNLIENAIRHRDRSRADAYARLRVVKDAGCVTLTVEDNGPGIPPDQQDKIWDRFFRSNPARTSGEGLGLGLCMVRAIVNRHGGTARVRSQPGQGSAFTLSFPSAAEGAKSDITGCAGRRPHQAAPPSSSG